MQKRSVRRGLVLRLFPFRINVRLQLSAADKLLEIADDGASSDPEVAGQGRNIGPVVGFGQQLTNGVLAAQPVCGTAEEVQRINPMRALQGLKLAHYFVLAAFGKGGLNRSFEGPD